MEFFAFFPVKSPIFAQNPIFLTKCPFPRLIFPKSPILAHIPYIYSIIFTILFIGRYPQKVPFWQGTHFPEKHHFDLPIILYF